MARQKATIISRPKQEVREALGRIKATLDLYQPGQPMRNLDVAQIRACVKHAEENLEQIQELKKQRRTPPAAPPQGSLTDT